MELLRVKTQNLSDEYEIKITRNGLFSIGENTRRWLGEKTHKIAVVSNRTVFQHYGAKTISSLQSQGFSVSQWLVGDGERFKSLSTVQNLLTFLTHERLERTDAILALGGGVIGDLAGFTAAIYLRGIRFLYVPTTLLAQVDSSVGGKTGVNLDQAKNLVGAFYQPSGVMTDIETLKTLPTRELISGCCEMVKQGAVSSKTLFRQTLRFLEKLDSNRNLLTSTELEKLIAAHCAFKASVVTKDQRENPDRLDHRSRKVLNFGHTTGHALEAITKFRRFRHGEAVGVGMLVAGELSKNLGLLSESELELLTEAIKSCGPLPRSDNLDDNAIANIIRRDKKNISGHLHWVLLEEIGRAKIVSDSDIPPRILKQSLKSGLKKASKLRNKI